MSERAILDIAAPFQQMPHGEKGGSPAGRQNQGPGPMATVQPSQPNPAIWAPPVEPDMVEQKKIVPALFCLSILQDWEHNQILDSAMTQESPWISIAEIPVTAWTKLDVSQECGFNRYRKRSVPTELDPLETVLWHWQAKEGIVEAGLFQYGHTTVTESGLVIPEKFQKMELEIPQWEN